MSNAADAQKEQGRINLQHLADHLNQVAINGYNYRLADRDADKTPPILFKVVDHDGDIPYAMVYGEQHQPERGAYPESNRINETLSPIGVPIPGSPGLYTSTVTNNPSYHDGERFRDTRGNFLLVKTALRGGHFEEYWILTNPAPVAGNVVDARA